MMRWLEIVVELGRGAAITVVAAWLFIWAWLMVSAPAGVPDSPSSVSLGSALMAGTAVYFLWPILVPLGCLLGYLTASLAGSPLPRSIAAGLGAGLGLVAGGGSAWIGLQTFGRDTLPPLMSDHPNWILATAAVFAALVLAVYVRLRTKRQLPDGDGE
jgi:hypothetical protein